MVVGPQFTAAGQRFQRAALPHRVITFDEIEHRRRQHEEAPIDAGAVAAGLLDEGPHLVTRALKSPEAARRLHGQLFEGPLVGPGYQAYLRILDAAAAALAECPEDALRNLDEATRLDPRMDPVARALRRRLEKNRPPLVRF